MWLLPPGFPRRPLGLVPNHRALPWYATREEIEQLMELLLRMTPELRAEISALSRTPPLANDRSEEQS